MDFLPDGCHGFASETGALKAKDVDKALHEIVALHGGMTPDEAAAYVENLIREKRYLRDVY